MSTAKLEKKIWKLETKLREEFRAELQNTMVDCIARVEKLEAQIRNHPILSRRTSEEEGMITISVDELNRDLKDSFSIDDLADAGWADELMGLLLLLGSATVQILGLGWGDDSLVLSNAQAGIIAEINSFLGLGLLEFQTAGLRPGMVLSTLCILLWCLYLLKEFRLVGTGVEAILHVARSGATTFEHGSFRTISYYRCWFFCFTSLMRMAIAAGILYAGIIWLANTASITELMLNAVALGSVMEVDEMIFSAMMPKRIQNRVQELEAVKICFTRRRSQCEALILVLFILGLLLWPWHFLLEPLGSTMLQVKHAYCGGERDFVVAMNDDVGVIFAQGTESYQRTDHNSATLIETAVQDYAFVGFSDFVSFQETAPAFANKRVSSIADAASTVQSCNDFDTWFVFGKPKSVIDYSDIYAVYWRTVTFSLGFGENTTCLEMVDYCDRSSLLRLVCGPTCGCRFENANSWFMVEAQGCSRVCLSRRREFLAEVTNYPENCVDVERDDERWLALWDARLITEDQYPVAAASYGKITEPTQLEHLSWTAFWAKEVGCAALQNNDNYLEPVTKSPWCAGFDQFFSPLSQLCPATCLGCGDYSCQDVRTGVLQALAPHLNATNCADIVARGLCDQPGLEAASLYCCLSCAETFGGQDGPEGNRDGEDDGQGPGYGNGDAGHDGADGGDGASEAYGSADDGGGEEGGTGYGDGEGSDGEEDLEDTGNGDGDEQSADEAGYGGDRDEADGDDEAADEAGYGDEADGDDADEAGYGGDGDDEDTADEGAKRKAIFELRAATNEEDSPSICVVAAPKEHGHLPQLLTTLGRRFVGFVVLLLLLLLSVLAVAVAAGVVVVVAVAVAAAAAVVVVEALVAGRRLKEPVFSFFLGDEEDGQLVLGGVDDRHFEGKFHFVPVVSTAYWQILLDNIKVAPAAPLAANCRDVELAGVEGLPSSSPAQCHSEPSLPPDWRRKNIRANIAFQFLMSLAWGTAMGPVFDKYLFLLGSGLAKGPRLIPTMHANSLVGVAESVSGLTSLVVAIPVGYIVDRQPDKRARLARMSSCLAVISVLSGFIAVLTDELLILTVMLVSFGAFMELSSSVTDAIFADSIPAGERSAYYVTKSVLTTVGCACGPGISALGLAMLGDKIVIVGGLLLFIPTLLPLFVFHDPVLTESSAGEAAASSDAAAPVEEGGSEPGTSTTASTAEEEAAAPPPTVAEAPRCLCFRSKHVPALLALADFITCIGAGMTVKFFNLFFIQEPRLLWYRQIIRTYVAKINHVAPCQLELCLLAFFDLCRV
eukprot:s622_g7.t2